MCKAVLHQIPDKWFRDNLHNPTCGLKDSRTYLFKELYIESMIRSHRKLGLFGYR